MKKSKNILKEYTLMMHILKKIALVSACLLTTYLISFYVFYTKIPNTMNAISQRSYFLTEDGDIIPPLKTCLALCNITYDGTLSHIVQLTQKNWLRAPHQERWQQGEFATNEKEKFLDCFHQLHMVEEIRPQARHYTYALLLGGVATRMRTRLAYLLELWNNGVRFDHLIILVGERPLDPTAESPEILFDYKNDLGPFAKKEWNPPLEFPQTETDAMVLILSQAQLPEEFQSLPIVIVDTPAQFIEGSSDKKRRPTTADTIKQWLTGVPRPGSCLVISSQPFVGYQDSVVKTFLPTHFSVETVGAAAKDDIKIATMLDTLARWIYQENQRISGS
jgi:hypothetical protein